MPKYKIKLNDDSNQTYTIKDGFTYEDFLNETLDSAKIVFETEGYADIESFDDIKIYDDTLGTTFTDKDMLVDQGFDEIAYFEPTEATRYEIDIFSRTKWLERFTCPSLSITKNNVVSTDEDVVLSGIIEVEGTKNQGQKVARIPLTFGMFNLRYNSLTISTDSGVPEGAYARIVDYTSTSIRYQIGQSILNAQTYGTLTYTVNNPSTSSNQGVMGKSIDGNKYFTVSLQAGQTLTNASIQLDSGYKNDNEYGVVDSISGNTVFCYVGGENYDDTICSATVKATIKKPASSSAESRSVNGRTIDGTLTTYVSLQSGETISNVSIQVDEEEGIGAFGSIESFDPNTGEIQYKIGQSIANRVTYGTIYYTKNSPASERTANGYVTGTRTAREGAVYSLSSGEYIDSAEITYMQLQNNNVVGAFASIVSFDSNTGVITYRLGQSIQNANVEATITYSVSGYSSTVSVDVNGRNIDGTKTYTPSLSSGQSITEPISIRLDGAYLDPFANIISNDANGNIYYDIGDNDEPDTMVEGRISYNVTVSQKIYGTGRSVWYYIEKYCKLFLPKVNVRISNSLIGIGEKYLIASSVQSKFESIVCPEFQWNQPTLREVLTDLMSTANCIPILKGNNEIDYLDLSAIRNSIDQTKIERIRSNFTSSDNCNELSITLKNAIGRSKTRLTEYTSLRSLSGELTTENAVLITQHPIYNIVKVILCYFDSQYNPGKNRYRELDISEYVVEKKNWDTLLTTTVFNSVDKSLLKANHLYYNRGQNTIEGWGLTYRMRPYSGANYQNKETPKWIITSLGAGNDYTGTNLRDLMIKVEYETLSEHSIHIGKYLPSKHYGNRIFDNQSNSYVDIEHQSMFEYFKVNRLGNKIKTMYAIYDNETELPQLGDYLNKNNEKLILFHRKIQYYDSQIVFEGNLVNNYVLKDYFTGVLAKKRSWAIAEGKEALNRINVYKYFLEASFISKNDSGARNIINYSYLLSAFAGYLSSNTIKWALLKTIDRNSNYYPSTTEAYSIESVTEVAGNSIIFSFELGDNFSVGKHVEIDDSVYQCNDYAYVDENGEAEIINISFASAINPSDGDFVWPEPEISYDGDTLKNNAISKARIKNLVKMSACTTIFGLPANTYLYKDNREIISGVVQFELCSDTPNIILKNGIWKYSSLYNELPYQRDLKVYMSTTETYDLYDESPKGNYVGTENSVVVTDNKISVARIGQSCISWCICDTNNKILVAVNSPTKEIYLNFLSTRDRNIYDATTRKVIGHMDN